MQYKGLIIFLFIFILFFTLYGRAIAKDWIIKPGVGIGWIKIGMKYSYIKRSLGEAESVTRIKNGTYCSYKRKYGIALLISYGGDLLEIEIYRDRCGKTKFYTASGLTVGKDIREAFKYYGKPVFTEPESRGKKYVWRNGMSVLSGADSKVKVIIITSPIKN